MKHNTNGKTMAGIALGASLLGGAAWAAQSGNAGTMAQGCQKIMGSAMSRMGGMSCCAPKGSAGQPAAATQSQDIQRATVTIKDGYTPSTINVKAGKPVELTFIGKGSSCANTVNIPALDKTLTLKDGEKKTLTFTPKKGQTLAFACPMNMFKGEVVAH